MAHAADLPAAEVLATSETEAISFEELCSARFVAMRSERAEGFAEPEYQRARKQFERVNGPITEAWWSN